MDKRTQAEIEKAVDDVFAKEFGIAEEIMTARTLPGGQAQINIYHRHEGEEGYTHYQGSEDHIRKNFYQSTKAAFGIINVGMGAIAGGIGSALCAAIFKWKSPNTWQSGLLGAAGGSLSGAIIGSFTDKSAMETAYQELITTAKNTQPPSDDKILNATPLPLNALENATQKQTHAAHIASERNSSAAAQHMQI